MKILYTSTLYDYNDKNRGFSYDFYNILPSFQKMSGIEIILYDCSDFGNNQIKDENNAKLIQLIERERPDVMFHFIYTDQLTKETLKFIKTKTKTTSINWFSDDHWRFDSFSKDLCWYFDYCITTDRDTLPKYEKIGYKNILLSQWGANPDRYPKQSLPFKHNISFVGQPHGDRRETITHLNKKGLNVECFGYGWKETSFKRKWNKYFNRFPFLQFDKGKISHEKMINVFNQSKINLNLAASSMIEAQDQIKGRNFEVPCCGAFLLTKNVSYLNDFYIIGKEIATYNTLDEMEDKIRYYLKHENERQSIANAGYKRTISDHTYEKRLINILRNIKLKN